MEVNSTETESRVVLSNDKIPLQSSLSCAVEKLDKSEPCENNKDSKVDLIKEVTSDVLCAEGKSSSRLSAAFLLDHLSNGNHSTDCTEEIKNEEESSSKLDLIVESETSSPSSVEKSCHSNSVEKEPSTECLQSVSCDEAPRNEVNGDAMGSVPSENSYAVDRQVTSDTTNEETSNTQVSKQACDTATKSDNKYRCDSDSWSSDEDSSSTSSDSDASFLNVMHERLGPKKFPIVKTKGELDLNDLPLIEDLVISVSEKEMELIGKVHAIVDELVVVHALNGSKPLDFDSVLFLSHEQPLGRVFEIFGPVVQPFYSVRFNSVDHIKEKGVIVDADVFFVPDKEDITTYVFLDELKIVKGSDASWKDNNEPPEECLDYSDDEQERAARKKRTSKQRNRNKDNSDIAAKRQSLQGSDNYTTHIPPLMPPNRNFRGAALQYSRMNPFNRPLPSPSPSLCSLPSVHVPHSLSNRVQPSYAYRSPQASMAFQQPPRPSQSPLLVPSFQQPVFGQVAVFNTLSPAIQSPSPFQPPVPFPSPSPFQSPPPFQSPSPFQSPPPFQSSVMPTFVSAPHLSPVPPQRYFNQRLSRTPSPALQTGPLSPDPWLPNRSPVPLTNLPPNAPLTVQIPSAYNNPSLSVQSFEATRPFVGQQNLNFRPQFIHQQGINLQTPFLNRSDVRFPGGNIHPRFG